MISPTVKATYEGKPLSVLNDLIEKRKQWLNETYKDSIVATAITALRSIRALTLTHYGKSEVYVPSDVVTIRRADIHPSFTGKEHKRCFRAGALPTKNAPRVDLGTHCVQLVPPGDRAWSRASVWIVKLSKSQLERWPNVRPELYIVATSQEAALNYAKSKFGKIAKRQAGLARAVLTSLMSKLSTRPPASERYGAHVAKLIKRFGFVSEKDSDKTFSVHIESRLLYALDAVKGKASGVTNALKSAANKIVGLINHTAGAKLDEKLATPFPEVKRK